jgi:hypothetical protein
MIFSFLDTHIFHRRKTFRNRRKRVFETSELKFFSIHSSKSSWNCSHKSLFVRLSFSHFLIFVSTHFSQFWIFVFIQLWLRSDCARVEACEIENALTAKQICENLMTCRIVVSLFWLRNGTNLIDWDSKKEIAESNSLSDCWLAEIARMIDWDSKEEIVNQTCCFRAADSEIRLISDENLIKYDMWIWSDFITK